MELASARNAFMQESGERKMNVAERVKFFTGNALVRRPPVVFLWIKDGEHPASPPAGTNIPHSKTVRRSEISTERIQVCV